MRDATNKDRALDAWNAALFLHVDLISVTSNGNKDAGIFAVCLNGSSKLKLASLWSFLRVNG